MKYYQNIFSLISSFFWCLSRIIVPLHTLSRWFAYKAIYLSGFLTSDIYLIQVIEAANFYEISNANNMLGFKIKL